MNTLYDLEKPFEENVARGVVWEDAYPQLPPRTERFDFLGYKLNSLFGIAACPLTHGSRSVSFCSRLGYDIITYRSVRSIEWHGQKFPHWRYVDIQKQLSSADLFDSVVGSSQPFGSQEPSMANSFGIQSSKPEVWQKDFEIAKASLLPGQLLILSIMFTPETGIDIVSDAKRVASYANETSADVFEINLAHPNSGMKSLVYEDVEASVTICKAVRKSIDDRKLLAKVGFYKNPEILKEFMMKTRGIIDGISSTNTYGMTVVDDNGTEAFPGRPKAGVSGAAIRELSMGQAKTMALYKKELGYNDFVIVGIGGVTKPEHIRQYLDIPVDAVQCAVGAYADPLLASKFLQTL
jgi:dihydroorotate dehydrogenase (NAD+) catalytic subunit